MMTTLALLVAFLLPLPPTPPVPIVRAAMQPAPTIGPSDALGFDYLNADMTTYSVTRFEVAWDGGAWVALGIPTARTLADTSPGASTYPVVPPFTNGNHTFSVRAVNIAGAGGASIPFAFVAVGSVPTGVPANVRKIIR